MTGKKRFVPYGTQWIGSKEIASVVSVLESDWLSPGPNLDAFESEIADYCGARYAVAYSSGTAALHGAIYAAGMRTGDEGVTSPFSWVSSANCMLYQGAIPRFCDIDKLSMNLSPKELRTVIGPKTRAIIPVHYAGLPCVMEDIYTAAKEVGAVVIEDAAHALGSTTDSGKVGACTFSDMTCFSFHPVKAITTGEGGMVLTNKTVYRDSLSRFRNQGIVRNVNDVFPEEGPWYFEMEDLGYNYRMTNFQAAIGLVQLERLDSFLHRRQEIRRAYDQAFETLAALEIPSVPSGNFSAFHLYVIRLHLHRLALGRKEIFLKLREKGLGVQVHYPPIHLHPYYRRHFGYQPGDFPVTEETYRRAITIPIYPKMTDDDVRYVIDSVTEVIGRAEQ